MSGSARSTGFWLAIFLCLVLSCGRPPSADVREEMKGARQAQPKATSRATQPSEPVTPMTIGGEVSAPKPITRLHIRWPGDRTPCYQLGVALFEGVVDRNGKSHDVKLIKGPDNEFTQAAREAIAQRKFEPAMYRGKPVDVTYHISINHVPVKKVNGRC